MIEVHDRSSSSLSMQSDENRVQLHKTAKSRTKRNRSPPSQNPNYAKNYMDEEYGSHHGSHHVSHEKEKLLLSLNVMEWL